MFARILQRETFQISLKQHKDYSASAISVSGCHDSSRKQAVGRAQARSLCSSFQHRNLATRARTMMEKQADNLSSLNNRVGFHDIHLIQPKHCAANRASPFLPAPLPAADSPCPFQLQHHVGTGELWPSSPGLAAGMHEHGSSSLSVSRSYAPRLRRGWHVCHADSTKQHGHLREDSF